MRRVKIWAGLSVIAFCLLSCGLLALLPVPHDPFWQLASGYYRYDPRTQTAPAGLFLDRPEDSLRYYMEATLAACDGRYPPASHQPVQHYEIEAVEFQGKSSYGGAAVYGTTYVHTRLFYQDGNSVLVTFRFMSGHNELDPWYLEYGSLVRVGSWVHQGGLLKSPTEPPPGWRTASGPTLRCQDLSQPFAIER